MKSYERDGLRALLEKIATELETANAKTREAADRYEQAHPGSGGHFQAGSLGMLCTEQGAMIRVAIRSYLTLRRAPRARRAMRAV